MASIRRIRTVFSGVAGTPWYSNMHFTWVNGTEQDHLDAVGDFWGAIDVLQDDAITWAVESDATVINDATGDIIAIESGVGPTGAGTATFDPLPYQTQGLVNWLTGTFVAGRQLRGKTYVPGLTENANDASGIMTTAARDVIAAAATALVAASSVPGPLRVFSRKNLTSATVGSFVAPTKWAVMRSRRD